MKRVFVPVLIFLCFEVSALQAQAPPRNGWIFVWSIPEITGLPLYEGQPSDVATAYLWFDRLAKSSNDGEVIKYIRNMQCGDTSKFLAKMLYRIIDDNPLALMQWPGSDHAFKDYHVDPGRLRLEFQRRMEKVCPDSGRTAFLLRADIIADVRIADTSIVLDTAGPMVNGSRVQKNTVLVHSIVLDTIKGKYVPEYISTLTKGGKHRPLFESSNIWRAYPVLDTPGVDLFFQYDADWSRHPYDDGTVGPSLYDSTGWWVKPDSEYVIFFQLRGNGIDSSYDKALHGIGTYNGLGYFCVTPYWGVFGTNAAMYPVRNGLVYDPNDDFGMGASAGLPVGVWKTRLRARITALLNP